jgi:hypothetical protein
MSKDIEKCKVNPLAFSKDIRWRNIVEMSCMINNDEFIFYSKEEVMHEHIKKYIRGRAFDDPKLMLSRPVFQIEIEQGLDVFSGVKDVFSFEDPNITKFIDAYFKVKQAAWAWQDFLKEKFTVSKFLSRYVGNSMYDCMSGGLPMYELLICRELVQNPEVDRTEYVYPTSDKKFTSENNRDYYNLQDFLNETKDADGNCSEELKNLKNLMCSFSFPALADKN